MGQIAIQRNGTLQLTPNFREGEFHTSANAPDTIFLDDRLPGIAQYIRNLAGVPVVVTSTVRYPGDKHYAATSQHAYQKARAIDLAAKGSQAQRVAQILHQAALTKNNVFRDLLAMGVRGFGLYDTFMHLDVRDTGGSKSYNGIPYAMWDYRTVKKNYDTGDIDVPASVTDWLTGWLRRYEDDETHEKKNGGPSSESLSLPESEQD